MLYHPRCRSMVFIAFPRAQSGNIARRETPSISACYVQTPVLANEKARPERGGLFFCPERERYSLDNEVVLCVLDAPSPRTYF